MRTRNRNCITRFMLACDQWLADFASQASELDLAIRVYYSLHNPYLQTKEQTKEL